MLFFLLRKTILLKLIYLKRFHNSKFYEFNNIAETFVFRQMFQTADFRFAFRLSENNSIFVVPFCSLV